MGLGGGGREEVCVQGSGYSLNVHSNATCVDLLFWAVKDEAGIRVGDFGGGGGGGGLGLLCAGAWVAGVFW